MTLKTERITSVNDLGPFCLRSADAAECRAGGVNVSDAIESSIKSSTEAFGVWYSNRLLAVWGFRSPSLVGSGSAYMWLLTTAEVDKHKITFYREGKRLLKVMLERFDSVECHVWRPYKKSIAWLKRLGFLEHTFQNLNCMPEFVRMKRENNGH